MKNMKRAERRKKDFSKAIRKRNICKSIYEDETYDNLHEYSKNKIHCSDAYRSNLKVNNRGRKKYYGKGSKLWKYSDLKQIINFKEYITNL